MIGLIFFYGFVAFLVFLLGYVVWYSITDSDWYRNRELKKYHKELMDDGYTYAGEGSDPLANL